MYKWNHILTQTNGTSRGPRNAIKRSACPEPRRTAGHNALMSLGADFSSAPGGSGHRLVNELQSAVLGHALCQRLSGSKGIAAIDLPDRLGLLVPDIDKPNRDFVALAVLIGLRSLEEHPTPRFGGGCSLRERSRSHAQAPGGRTVPSRLGYGGSIQHTTAVPGCSAVR